MPNKLINFLLHTHPLVFPAKLQIHKHSHEYQSSLKESICIQGAYGNMKLEIVENVISLPMALHNVVGTDVRLVYRRMHAINNQHQ